ncbi:MAG: Rieske 2Fe-2S domain-containing protein [Candidatus Dormibacteraceae bacterium]
MIRNSWYAAGFSDEFDTGRLQGHTIAGRPLVIWRAESGAMVALDARCAHKRFPLWDGRLLAGDVLECAYHGFAYDTGGRCVAIPALHEQSDLIPRTARQRKYPLVEQDGVVWVWPGDPDGSAHVGVPRTPEIGDDGWRTINTEPMEVAANYRLLIENLFDLTHFYPLHAGNIGSLADAQVPVEIERGGWEGNPTLKTTRRRSSFRMPPMTRDRFGLEIADQIQTHEMRGPGLFHVTVRVAPPGRLGTDEEQGFVLYQTITPIDEDRHIWRRSTSTRVDAIWAGNPERSLVEAVVEGAPVVIEQDRWAIERQQRMFAYPDDGYREVHVRTDGAVVMARRMLDELEVAEEERQGEAGPPSAVRSQPARRLADLV